MERFKGIIAIILISLLALGLAACGTEATISIDDDGMVTELDTKLPRTVEKILADGGITLGEGDVVTPSLDTKLSEAQEIVVERKHTVNLALGDGSTKEAGIVGGTVGDLLKQEGINLTDKQMTSVPLDEPIKEGMEIKIVDMLSLSIICDGKTVEKNVSSLTVGDALKECGVTLGNDDRVNPDIKTALKEGMEVTVERVKIEEVKEKEAIDYEVAYEYTDSLNLGYESVSVEGENGEREVTYKITYVDGEEESREVVSESVIKEPVTAVVLVGTYEEPVYTGPYELYRENFPDCDGSGHGYYEVHYSDGSVAYIDY